MLVLGGREVIMNRSADPIGRGSSPVTGNLSRPNLDCPYCETFLNADYAAKDPWDVQIVSGEGYTVVPAKGALLPGWLLVVGKEHILCSAALTDKQAGQLQTGVDRAVRMVEESFGPATIFESGPSERSMPIGCGVDHVHLHVLPLGFSLAALTSDHYPEVKWTACADVRDLREIHRDGNSYVYVREPVSGPLVAVVAPRISQLLRQVIAIGVKQPSCWNYLEYPFPDSAEATLRRIEATEYALAGDA
jgi:ATP adenylyltransferase